MTSFVCCMKCQDFPENERESCAFRNWRVFPVCYLCAPVYRNGCENTHTYELKQHVGVGLLVSPLNLCGQVIPAARDSPRQELALSVIPLTFVPPSFLCAVKFLSFLISHFPLFFVFLSSLNFPPYSLCYFLPFLVIKCLFSAHTFFLWFFFFSFFQIDTHTHNKNLLLHMQLVA